MDEIYLSREQSRAVDRIAIEQFGIPSIVLMENAGRGVANLFLRVDPSLKSSAKPSPIAILCGKGNNAGDGFVLARHLLIHGVSAKVIALAPINKLSGDANTNFEALEKINVPVVDLSSSNDLASALSAETVGVDWLVDAMLGTGAVRSPYDPFKTAIEWMNCQSAQRLALDIPSGLDCDTGKAAKTTVRADRTCTFFSKKIGFVHAAASEYLGQVHVINIGVPLPAVNSLLDLEYVQTLQNP